MTIPVSEGAALLNRVRESVATRIIGQEAAIDDVLKAVPGFTLFPSRTGVRTLDAATHAADRWMREANSSKDHWIFAAGGFPEAHGEASQERAIWSALAWGTSRPQIKGLVVSEAGDYGTITGLRAPDGHLRRATFAVMTAMRGLREAQPVAPTLRVQQ